MKIKKVWIYDIEQFLNFHSATFIDRDSDETKYFVIHNSRNDIIEYYNFLKNEVSGLIGFNNLAYDYQLIHEIYTNFNKLLTKDVDYITSTLKNLSDKVINAHFPPISYWKVKIPQLDLFKIWHFDNDAKRTSLKAVEMAINFENIESLPFDSHYNVKDEDVTEILKYNLNDVKATKELYNITIGNTEIPLYKGVDKIKLRKDISKEYGIDCLNYNDVKIGESINKKVYCDLSGKSVQDFKNLRTERTSIKLKDCIPSYIKFETPELNKLLNNIINTTITTTKDNISFRVLFNGTVYKMALGGLHSEDKPRKIIPKDNEILEDADVASMYPKTIINNKIYPEHLGEVWLEGYIQTADKRITAKKNNQKSVAEALKLSLNGGGYGKTNEPTNWQYDPLVTMKTTITGQLSLLMLIEMLELRGLSVVSANTDGIVTLYNVEQCELYYNTCSQWEKITGYSLEYNTYEQLIQMSVNDYIAIKNKSKDEVKLKGDFEIDKELHKNHSMKIVPIALKNYFVNKIPVKETIRNHNNIYDFCLFYKATSGWNPIMHKLVDNKKIISKLDKNLRYFISTNGGTLYKEHKDKRIIGINVGYKITPFNRYYDSEDYKIDYRFYENETNKIISKIETEQLTLF